MAHHQRATKHPGHEGPKNEDFKVHSPREVEKKSDVPPPEKKESIFEYHIAGFSWPFVLIMSLMAIAVLGMILKVMGVY